ncbi:MAG TPA: tRNA (adenosine(37)-N6)-threonylcarbamoyltransferase complex ATPase subunit type 1 TsaE [bacterium]|nr:tRNA (adenosine(37)-N6)-threonylcarbamoyltransferase complex ATPase subunit type 1 TsaE [bacterium]
MKHTTRSPEETFELARAFAAKLMRGDVLSLKGELGAGKTRFVQGLAAGLGVPAETYVRSPSFVLMNEYPGGRLPLYHFDFYRLVSAGELSDLGLEEYFYGDGVTAVEWADRFPGAMPETAFDIEFRVVDENVREIEFVNRDW